MARLGKNGRALHGTFAESGPTADTPPLNVATEPGVEVADGVTEGSRWRALLAMLVGITIVFSNIYATQPILPALGRDFDVPPAASALTVSVVVLGLGIASLIYGPLSDRTGRKPVVVATACLLVLPTLGVTLASSFSALGRSRV